MARPTLKPEQRAKQVGIRLPPDIISFLSGKENKSKLIVDAIRRQYKIKIKKKAKK